MRGSRVGDFKCRAWIKSPTPADSLQTSGCVPVTTTRHGLLEHRRKLPRDQEIRMIFTSLGEELSGVRNSTPPVLICRPVMINGCFLVKPRSFHDFSSAILSIGRLVKNNSYPWPLSSPVSIILDFNGPRDRLACQRPVKDSFARPSQLIPSYH